MTLDEPQPLSNETVTEYTSSLWKYKPVDSSMPEPHDEYCYKSADIKNTGKIFGARVRGKKHKHEGTNCDDWFEFDSSEDWLIFAVSDGAGSKKLSRIGAKSACKGFVNYVKAQLENLQNRDALIPKLKAELQSDEFSQACGEITLILRNGMAKAYADVVDAFESRKNAPEYIGIFDREMLFKDFSATLLTLIAIPLEDSEYLMAACQIGDGMIACIDANEQYEKMLTLLGEADGGDFSGETDFITSENMVKHETLMKRTKVARRKISHIMMMTDGVADDYYPYEPNLKRLYADLIINGILPYADAGTDANTSNDANTSTNADANFKENIPEPLTYGWVNNPDVKIGINYMKRIMEKLPLSLEDALENQSLMQNAASMIGLGGESVEESLKIWLDNYVERGSFDDRTLVIFKAV